MNLRDLPDMTSAYKQVQEKNDGNLANNAPPYDKVTRRDVITGRLGKDEMGGKRKKHDCAKKVNYKNEEFDVIPEQHTMLEDGTVTHYDITNDEYIYENVPVEDLEILISEKHEHFDNYDKNAEVLGENRAAMGRIAREYKRKKEAEEMEKRSKAPKDRKPLPKRKDDNPMYDAKSAGSSRVKDFKFTGEEVEVEEGYGAPGHNPGSGEKSVARAKALMDKQGRKGAPGLNAMKAAKAEHEAKRGVKKEAYDNTKGNRHGDGPEGTAKRKAALEKKRGMKLDGHPQFKEAFLFSDEEVAQLHIIDECTDEELIDFMIEAIQELAIDQEDLIEICEALEGVEVLSERMDPKEVQRRRDQAKDRLSTGAAMKRAAEKSSGPSRMDRLKTAAKKAGSMVKSGVKTAGKKAVQTAGKVAGEFSAAKEKQKKAAMSRPEKSSSSSSDDDGTGGKLDKLLADTRGTSSSSSSSSSGGGGSSSSSSGSSGSSSSGSTRRAVGGALRKVGGLLKKGLKKAVGKTARVVSSGSDKLAKKLGEQYDEIADMYESGLFTIQEIENVVELYKGKHGQTDKQYADSRSSGGKMVSGDSKMSGAEYTHGRRVKAANPGMQPDVGGKTKPKSQGRMDRGTRADLEYRKANLKKKD